MRCTSWPLLMLALVPVSVVNHCGRVQGNRVGGEGSEEGRWEE